MSVRNAAVVSAILLDPLGRVLLQQRDDKPDLAYSGYWTLFGGTVEPGETPDEAIERELLEELDLSVPLVQWSAFVDPARTSVGDVITMHTSYHGTLDRDLRILTLHEGQNMAFFRPQDAVKLELAFMQTTVLRAFFKAHRTTGQG